MHAGDERRSRAVARYRFKVWVSLQMKIRTTILAEQNAAGQSGVTLRVPIDSDDTGSRATVQECLCDE